MKVCGPCLALQLYLKLLPLILHFAASLTLCSLTALFVHKQLLFRAFLLPQPWLISFCYLGLVLQVPSFQRILLFCSHSYWIRIVPLPGSPLGPDLCQIQITIDMRTRKSRNLENTCQTSECICGLDLKGPAMAFFPSLVTRIYLLIYF